jgi:hypothetical protein
LRTERNEKIFQGDKIPTIRRPIVVVDVPAVFVQIGREPGPPEGEAVRFSEPRAVISRRAQNRYYLGAAHPHSDAGKVLFRDPVHPRPEDERANREDH